ncbi:MAG: integrase core domain-containing protein [Firmicutes bacterium]|nr:integrase core domain-containing protein [Bacillota bacterium]
MGLNEVCHFFAYVYTNTYGMQASFSRAGHGDDHACIESWHRLLKKELLYQHRWATRNEAPHALFPDIERFDHRQRLHRALGYRTPQAMLDQALAGGLTSSVPGGLPAVKAGAAADRLSWAPFPRQYPGGDPRILTV